MDRLSFTFKLVHSFRNTSLVLTRPVLLVILIVLSEVIPPGGQVWARSPISDSHSSSTVTRVNHNRLFSDATLKRKYDPYSDDFLDLGKGVASSSSAIKRGRSKSENFDSDEILEKSGGGASGKPLSTSVKDNLAEIRDDTECPSEFGGYCKCGYQFVGKEFGVLRGNRYIVNCTDAGFSSPQPLQHLPDNTEILIFTGNNLPNLPSNIFGNMNTYPDLVYIDLSSNGIQNILGKTFHRVNATETLVMNNNNISRLTLKDHKRIFSNFVNLKTLMLSSAFDTNNADLLADFSGIFIESNLTRLEKLHLEHNGIDYVNDPAIFCQLPSLMDLHLSQNILTDLNLDITCLNHMRYIDLTYNNIRTIGENSGLWNLLHERNHEGSLIEVNLWNNPFECDCRLNLFLETVRNWTRTNPDKTPMWQKLTCHDGLPKNNTGQLLLDVVYTECPVLQGSDYGSTAVSVIAWILGLLFLSAVGYFLYTNQGLLCRPASPLHQTTTQGVKYTTIQEEEAEVAHV